MSVIDVGIVDESQSRYLTYALSVVNSRALPDVRDGLKPVQRRILYAMAHNLRLTPDHYFRKSAAVVGEVLARYHPHGDSACYDAMVRMAQDFSLRYPLVQGQGNFGSLDGDSAAAYRYTEARLTKLAMEVIGDIGQETVMERDNFDQTVQEPVVLPSRVPNLLINGASGIAVGMATSIPPHNLPEVVKALLMMLEDEEVSDTKVLNAIKGPDFPTGCLVLNTKTELKEIYRSGRGAIRMRGEYALEKAKRGKEQVVVSSIPYGVDKSALVEKIADLIIARKVPQLEDIRDESTDQVRIVLELASGANAEKAMAYLFKHTPLQQNFNVNLTALVPTKNPFSGRPVRLSLREMLQHFVEFRVEVTRAKLLFEKGKLDERIHLLEGLVKIYDVLDEVIKIVRKSEGRSDAAAKLQKRFSLSEVQAFFIVDLRIYQLSKTSIEDVNAELAEKTKRVKEINRILKSTKALKGEVATDLKRISEEYGDVRRSQVVAEFDEPEIDKEDYIEHEEVYVVITADGWLKRIRSNNDPATTRMREGDSLFFAGLASTRDSLVIFSNYGNVFVCPVVEVPATSGFGNPIQKLLKFQDGEQIASAMVYRQDDEEEELFLYSQGGFGFRVSTEVFSTTKKSGKRIMRLAKGDLLRGVCSVDQDLFFFLSEQGYGLLVHASEINELSGPGKGVTLQKLPKDDKLIVAACVNKADTVVVEVKSGKPRELEMSALTISSRAKRGLKVVKRGAPVLGMVPEETEGQLQLPI